MSAAKTELLAVDLDGTLVDSAPDIADCLGRALEAVGLAAPGEARTRTWIGDGIETVIARALAAADAERAPRAPLDAQRAADRQAAVLAAFTACYRSNLFVRTELYPTVGGWNPGISKAAPSHIDRRTGSCPRVSSRARAHSACS